MKIQLALIFAFFVTLSVKAQTGATSRPTNTLTLQQKSQAIKQVQKQRTAEKGAPQNGQASAAQPWDENDPYEGRKQEFLNNLTVSELPADFPKYNKSYGMKGYNQILDNYYTQHLDILKDQVKQKILGNTH